MSPHDPTPEPPPLDHGPIVVGNVPCSGCGYNLAGIPISKVCPECGHSVAFSLRGRFLHFAPPEYIRQIDRGLCIILAGLVLYVLLTILSMLKSLLGNVIPLDTVRLISSGLMLACSGVFIVGYWKYTQPDAGFTGIEKPTSARTIARVAACAHAALELLGFIGVLLANSWLGGFGGVYVIVGGAAAWWLITAAIWATQFFSIMLYTRWMAARIPDKDLIERTNVYIWLLPLLCTVGLLFCVGPLIALILYATLLQSLRYRTKAILDWQARGGTPALGA